MTFLASLVLAAHLQAQPTAQPKPAAAPVKRPTKEDLAAIRQKVTAFYRTPPAEVAALPAVERNAKTAEFVAGLLKDIDPKTIPADDAGDWATLFRQARRNDDVISLEARAIENQEVKMMFSYADLIPALIDQGREAEVLPIIQHLNLWKGSMVGQLTQMVISAAGSKGLTKSNPELVASWLDAFSAKLLTGPANMKLPGNSMNDFAYVDIQMKKLEMFYALNPTDDIKDKARALRDQFANSQSKSALGESASDRAAGFLNTQSLIGRPAPDLVVDDSFGSLHSLADLKGKVVLLDFMAHWCGPCKAALPGIRSLQADFGAKGLQVVSVTSYYGYYGADKGLDHDQERQKMTDFDKKYEMKWPVVFDTKQVSHKRYGVSGIPHMVLIDKKGNVRKVHVGSGEEGEKQIRELVAKLVAE